MQPTLYGPDGRSLPPPAPSVKPPPSVIRKHKRAGTLHLLNLSKKSETNPSAEDAAIGRVMSLSGGGNVDRFLPIWFGGRVVGYAQSWRGSRRSTFYRHPLGEKVPPLGFAGISSYDDIIAALSAGRGYRSVFTKSNTTAPVANNWYDLWPVGGYPAAGAYGGTALTAKQFTDATAGALYTNGNVEATYQKYLLASACGATGGSPTLMLYDRVITWETCAFSASSQSFINTLTAQRYNGSGLPGLNIAVTGQTLTGGTASQFSALTYTNQAGSTAISMPTTRSVFVTTAAAAPTATLGSRLVAPIDTGGTVQWSQYLPVVQGDTGVRKLEAFTCSAANTGTLCFVGLREYMWIPLGTAGLPTQIDNVFQIGGLDRIYDGACLALMSYFPAATAATVMGFAKSVWN